MKTIIHFAQHHLEFRVPEFESIAQMFRVKFDFTQPLTEECPFAVVDFLGEDPMKDIQRMCTRLILVIDVYRYFADAESPDALISAARANLPTIHSGYDAPDGTWAMDCVTFGKRMSHKEQRAAFDRLSFVSPPSGSVDLRAPSVKIVHMYHFGENTTTGEPLHVFLGAHMMTAQRRLVHQYCLKQRPYLGPTSMDAELSLLMANMGLVGPGRVALDPFVGTGSVLVAATHFGSYCLGADMDIKIIGKYTRKGERREKTFFTNFVHYSLPPPSLVWADQRVNVWGAPVDTIVTDPPYGIRAFVKTVSGVAAPKGSKTEDLPRSVQTTIGAQLTSLVDFGAQHLTVGGRLVFWMPCLLEKYTPDDVPRHPALRLVANCFQGITELYGRRLITMEKVCEAGEGQRATSHAANSYDDVGNVVMRRRVPAGGAAIETKRSSDAGDA